MPLHFLSLESVADCVSQSFSIAEAASVVCDRALLSQRPEISAEFVWQEEARPVVAADEELSLPVIHLHAFLSGDPTVVNNSPELMREACERHGLFLVADYGVTPVLLAEGHRGVEAFFWLPLSGKPELQPRKDMEGGPCLPILIKVAVEGGPHTPALHLLPCHRPRLHEAGILPPQPAGSLWVDQTRFREFYESQDFIMLQEPDLTPDIGPHCDPTSLNVLHQVDVVGIPVFTDARWRTIRPCKITFAVNIRETLTTMTKGRYKRRLHRTIVNTKVGRTH